MYSIDQLHQMADDDQLNEDLLPGAIADACNWHSFLLRHNRPIEAVPVQVTADKLWTRLDEANSMVLDAWTYELLTATAVGTA